MRREAAFLEDILQAAGQIEEICSGRSSEDVSADRVLQAALLHHLTVIGEAANRLPPAFRARHPAMPWPQIIAQRNRIVHAYFGLDWSLIWTSAISEVPVLRDWAARVLAEEAEDEL